MKRKFKKNSGQTVMEYVLLTGLIGVMSIIAIRNFGDQMEKKFESMVKKINKTLVIR
jgi:Flp pilus assembly pilin Flp